VDIVAAVAGVTTISGSSQALISAACTYRGFSLRETAGTTAVVVLWDNASAASGPVLEEISLAANESSREYYDPGIQAVKGVYVQIVSGTVAGSVRTS
jgi:hypothetical protein